MKKRFVLIMFFSFLLVGFSKHGFVFAEEIVDTTSPVVTSYTLNGLEDSVVFNPNDPASVEIVINADELVKFNYIYICAESDEVCNGTTRIKEFAQTSFSASVAKSWDGKRSPATAGMSLDGVYKIKIKMVDEVNNETIVVLLPYTITIDTLEKPIEDITLPIITLTGEKIINLNIGNAYEDEGATASDDIDGDITSSIVKNGSVDTSTVGTYIITYDVLDRAGNNAEQVARTINVLIPEEDEDLEDEENENTLSLDITIDVPATCEVLDTDKVAHIYNTASTTEYIGICALKAALDEEFISSIDFSNQYPSMGLFVTSFNETEADASSQYWALYKNSGYTNFGISTLPISAGDVISFKLSDFSGIETGDYVNIVIQSLLAEESKEDDTPTSGGGGGGSNTKVFSVEDAILFLSLQQENDESLGGDLYLDWVSVAVGAEGNSTLRSKLVNYLKSNQINSSIVTDYERRAMALMALGVNPYNGTEVDYIKKIVDSFDGEQLGEKSLINDDIFGILVLSKVGYDGSDEIIKETIKFIINNQGQDGSFGSIDMTAAVIMALEEFDQIDGVSETISKANNYLIDSQENDGGFGNIFSTSWAIQALFLGGSFIDEIENGIQYLSDKQNDDGGVLGDSINNRIWATAYAISAVLELSWIDILNEFEKIEEVEISSIESNSVTNTEIKDEVLDSKINEIIKPTQIDTHEDKKITEKKFYTYLDFIDQIEAEDVLKEAKYKKIEDENKEAIAKIAEIDNLDLLANASLSTNTSLLAGNNIIWLSLGALAFMLGGFVIGRKI